MIVDPRGRIRVVAWRMVVDEVDEPVLHRMNHEQPDPLERRAVFGLESPACVARGAEGAVEERAADAQELASGQRLEQRPLLLPDDVDRGDLREFDVALGGLAELEIDRAHRTCRGFRRLEEFAGKLQRVAAGLHPRAAVWQVDESEPLHFEGDGGRAGFLRRGLAADVGDRDTCTDQDEERRPEPAPTVPEHRRTVPCRSPPIVVGSCRRGPCRGPCFCPGRE